MSDRISELIIKMKNASAVGKETVEVEYSKLKENILKVLKKEGYIEDFDVLKGDGIKKRLRVHLKYINGKARINDVKRISKLSKRIYLGYKDIKPVKFGYGIMVLTTPMGVITDKEAIKNKVGGEALFKIW